MADNKIDKYMEAADNEAEYQNDNNNEDSNYFSIVKNEVTDYMKKLFSKNDGKASVVTQEFLGFGKKYQVLSNVDFDLSLKQNDVKRFCEDESDIKSYLNFSTLFSSEVFNIIGRNNEGFSHEWDENEPTYALESLKESLSDDNDSPEKLLKLYKALKTKNDFTNIKEVKEDDFKRSYDVEKAKESIRYYRDTCMHEMKESLKTAMDEKANGKFIKDLKAYIDLSEKQIQLAEECVKLIEKVLKVNKA